ncbi:MAG: DUF4062 domain-containing protein, partial [Vulcanococcus sp.]
MTTASGSPPEEQGSEPPAPPEVSQDRVACRLPSSPPPWRVFLSHTSEFRRYPSSGGSYIDKAERAALAAGHQVGNMEHYRANDGDIGRFDELQVQASQVYVGIYGMRWGTPVPGQPELSYTVQEFDAASAAGIPRLIFVVDEHDDSGDVRLPISSLSDVEHGHRQQAFLRRIQSSGELIIKRFRGPDHLAGLVESSLRELEKQVLLTDGGRDQAPRLPSRRHYGPSELEAWVNRHHTRLERAFLGLPSVQARQVHVPLDVCLTPAGAVAAEGPRLLRPEDLEPLLAAGGSQVLLLSGDGGAGKTSLAFAIARWWLQGEPGGVVRLPVLIETALAEGESVARKVWGWLSDHLSEPPEEALVEALLRGRRLVPILDHVSELSPAARQRLLMGLPPGLVLATSRGENDGWPGRALSRIEPRPIALDRLQSFFVAYLNGKKQGDVLRDDELVPAQNQLRRIVGDKPITALLAQMFIDDVIDNRSKGLLAGSVPQLMLSYVRRLDTPADPGQRDRAGLTIDRDLVQRALKRLALASHRQAGADGEPAYQPQAFSRGLAKASLQLDEPDGLAMTAQEAEAVVGYLSELRLLIHPGEDTSELRFPLDPIADYLAALAQLEVLESWSRSSAQAEVWQAYLAALEMRQTKGEDLTRARGFFLALRDAALERGGRGVPSAVPDRLAELGGLNPEKERERLAEQRARKWMWELLVPIASERRDAIGKLAAMAAASAEPEDRRSVAVVASDRLSQVLANGELPQDEREEAAVVLGLIGTETGITALEGLASDGAQPPELRRAALEALGLAARDQADSRQRIEGFLEKHLRADALDLLVEGEAGWAEHDRQLPPLQGASRALQLAASAELPLLGSGPGRTVPMHTLTARKEGEALRIRTAVVPPAVWRLPLPGGEQLELV